VGVHVDHEAKVSGQVAANLLPGVASVVAAHDIHCFCMKSTFARERCMHVVNAMADLRIRVGIVLGMKSLVDGPPGSCHHRRSEGPAAEMAM